MKFDGSNWTIYNESNSILPWNRIRALIIDEKDILWVGTHEGGLVKIDDANWTVYDTTNSGLPSDSVIAFAIDDNYIWIGTGTFYGGLAKFDGTNWTVFDTSNSGLPDNWVLAVAIDGSGNIWSGTWLGGLAAYREGGVIMRRHGQVRRTTGRRVRP